MGDFIEEFKHDFVFVRLLRLEGAWEMVGDNTRLSESGGCGVCRL